MQIRQSTLKGDRPLCPVDPSHTVHAHAHYDRCENCNNSDQAAVARFLCLPCGHTISVLPDRFLPRRAISVAKVEEHFDAQANPGQGRENAVTENEKGCLKRAWARFKQRVCSLTATLGQMIEAVKPSASQLWNQLRRKSNLTQILLQLANPFNTSLLADYHCLIPWILSTG
jgi:hypothetical protein